MIAIFKRDFKSLFNNVIGYLFLGANIAFFGLYFYVYNLSYGYPYLSYSLQGASFILLISVPILTMRSLSEDRKNKTDQLILTAPVSIWKIVVAKFLSMAAVFGISTLFICVTPFILRVFGEVPLAENYVSVLGYFLFGLVCIAVGLFVSSLTESMIISAIVSFVLIFIGYQMSAITNFISSDGNLVTKVLNCYDIYTPFNNLMNGELNVTSIIYYISLIVLVLFFTIQSIQKRRFTVNKSTLSVSIYSSVTTIIAIAIVVILNIVVGELPSSIISFDLTDSKLYSITDDTKEYINSLDKDITIYVLNTKASEDTTVASTLNKYDEADAITVKYINPTKNPNFASQYTDETVSSGALIVVCEDNDNKSRVIASDDLYETSIDYTTYSTSVTGYDAEGQITSAIQYVTSETTSVIYELTNHGEVALSGNFSDVLTKANLDDEELNLLTNDAIPDDCDALIINGPTSDLSEDDATKIINYINDGGSVFITLDYQYISNEPNLQSVLAAYNISVQSGLVADNDSSYYYNGTPFFLLPDTQSTTASTTNIGSTQVFAPYSVALTYDESDDNISPILTTSDSAVIKTDIANATTYEAEDGDIEGKATVGLCATEGEGTLVVYGSTYIFTDSADEIVSGKNSELFTDALNALVTVDDSYETIVVDTKDYTVAQITVSSKSVAIYGLLIPVCLPIILTIIGIVIWAIRRRK